MKLKTMFAIVASITTILGAGCFRSSDSPPPQPAVEFATGPELALAIDDSNVRITPAGATSPDTAPPPDDIPVFEHGSFTLETRTPAGEFVSYHVSPSVDELRRFYAEQLPAHGWEIDDEHSSGTSSTYVGTKAGRVLTVLLEENETGTAISLSHRDER